MGVPAVWRSLNVRAGQTIAIGALEAFLVDAFWQHLEHAMPDYDTRRQRLAENSSRFDLRA